MIGKGSVLHALQRYDAAIKLYDLALEINKKFALTYAYKGLALGEQGKITDALKYFKKALSIDKDLELASISKETALKLLDSKKTKK